MDRHLLKPTFHSKGDTGADTDDCLAHRHSPALALLLGSPDSVRWELRHMWRGTGNSTFLCSDHFWINGSWDDVSQGFLGKISHHDKKALHKKKPYTSLLSSGNLKLGAANSHLVIIRGRPRESTRSWTKFWHRWAAEATRYGQSLSSYVRKLTGAVEATFSQVFWYLYQKASCYFTWFKR